MTPQLTLSRCRVTPRNLVYAESSELSDLRMWAKISMSILVISEARARSAGARLTEILNAQEVSVIVKTSRLGATSPLDDCAHDQGDARRRCYSKTRRIDARIINGSHLNFNTQNCTL